MEKKEFRGRSLEDALNEASRYFREDKSRIEFQVIAEKTKFMEFKKREIVILAGIKYSKDEEEVSKFLSELLRQTLLDLDFKIKSREEIIEIILFGNDKNFLLEHKGELLNSLQYLLNKSFSNYQKRIVLDCQGFRKKRENKLIEIAKQTAENVIKSKKDESIGPLNPWERKIVHTTINNIHGVISSSTGKGFLKKVVISPVQYEK
ncbi:MAG: R3H domain-containing nucleic acid-binding protein [Acidobacteriota bacterium]